MGMNDGGRFFNAPSYTAAQWTTRNPLLLKGEIGWELHPDTGKPWRSKVGPGLWNDLLYQEDLYPYPEAPTNPIGDATGVLQYTPLSEILHKMLNPYQVPVMVSPGVNANSLGMIQTRTFEIGQTISTPVLVQASPSPNVNLALVNPYRVQSGGFFTNDGSFATLPASMTMAGPVSPSTITEVNIGIKALLTNGNYTNEAFARINVYPKMIWGCSAALSLAPGDWASLTGRQTLISRNFENDYPLATGTFGYLAIPTMLSPGLPIFTDVTNPEYPGPFGWQEAGVQTINNGVGTYSYTTYRTIYSMDGASVVRVRHS